MLSQSLVPCPHIYSLPDRNKSSLQTQRVFLGPWVLGQLGSNAGPVAENSHGVGVDLAVCWADTGQVDLADEVDDGWLLGVVWAALHLKFVDAVLVVSLWVVRQLAMMRWRGGTACRRANIHEEGPRWYLSSGS